MKPFRSLFIFAVVAAAAVLVTSSRACLLRRHRRRPRRRARRRIAPTISAWRCSNSSSTRRAPSSSDARSRSTRNSRSRASTSPSRSSTCPTSSRRRRRQRRRPPRRPTRRSPHYVLGLIARQQNRPEDALASFQRVLKLDPRDVGANVQLGQLYAQQRKYTEAVAVFRARARRGALQRHGALQPRHGAPARRPARGGAASDGSSFRRCARAARRRPSAQNYLEQGRYAEAVASTGAEADVVDKRTPEVAFADATASRPAACRRVRPTAATVRRAAALRLRRRRRPRPLRRRRRGRLLRNDGGKFADVTAQSARSSKRGLAASRRSRATSTTTSGPTSSSRARVGLALYRNEGGGRFTDVTAAARIPAYPYIVARRPPSWTTTTTATSTSSSPGGAMPPQSAYSSTPNLLLRNNGDGTFADVTAGVKADARARHARGRRADRLRQPPRR